MARYYDVPRLCGIYYIPTHITVYAPSWLPQVSLSTEAQICDTASRTRLTQTFVNPSKNSAITSAKYTFPLYESCAVVSFRCFVGDRLIEGIVKEKEEAKQEYKEAVARGETAGLLERHTPDVFSTSIGNIPAGATVRVEIAYIMELKHDAEVDGLRFTIPTSIAPRYGDAPSGLATFWDGQPIPGAQAKGGMKISVQIVMPSIIRSVQSPSHNIAVHLGGCMENVPDDAYNPKHALTTLTQTSTELGADFVLLVKCADLSSPRALLEAHPTLPNSKALMVTLVPKFTLPSGPKPEIVFVVDRSGSMSHRMNALRSSLAVFLKSLPLGVKFNICSFGSDHSFLWNKSQSYSESTLNQAQKHVESMAANLGGTEILAPIKATISRRYKDLPLDIMVLTDGQVWNADELFKYIEKNTVSGDVRLFSLGIGQDVSHSLVEGMARVGRGFAQIVSDEKESIEGKVVRMLRGALSAHIKDYRLEWEGKPAEARAQKIAPSSSPVAPKKISLFDTKAPTDTPLSGVRNRADRFAHLPAFVPSVLQAPYKLPPLFPFSRSTAFTIISGDALAPSSVWLRGTTPSGDQLELEIPVQTLQDKDETIHQLAARKVLQELEEGTGYLHSGKYGVDQVKNEGTFGDWVEREGIRVGVRYGLASKWTSIVAVGKKKVEAKTMEADEDSVTELAEEEYELVDVSDLRAEVTTAQPILRTSDQCQTHSVTLSAASASLLSPAPTGFGGSEILQQYRPAPSLFSPLGRSTSQAFHASSIAAPPYHTFGSGFIGGDLPMQYGVGMPAGQSSSPAPVPTMKATSWAAQRKAKRSIAPGDNVHAMYIGGGSAIAATSQCAQAMDIEGGSAIAATPQRVRTTNIRGGSTIAATPERVRGMDIKGGSAIAATLQRDQANALISLQTFEGSFALTSALASVLGASLSGLEAKLAQLTSAGVISKCGADDRRKLWATALAAAMFEGRCQGEKDMWELVVEKAKTWMAGLVGRLDMALLEGKAVEVIAAL